jgi:hypothetical protein
VVDSRESSDAFARWVSAARSYVSARPDLTARLEAIASRAARSNTVVAVVGEFKQGKSALVNSLLTEAVCPIDDHAATSVVTVVSHGTRPSVVVRGRGDDGESVARRVDPAQRRSLIVEGDLDGSPTLEGVSIERIDIQVPNPLLSDGLVLVDTPGVGGSHEVHTRATKAFLHHADALVFVSDATSELTEPEVAFLREALVVCPATVVALSKIDMFPEWRRIAELDRGHLERAGVDAPVFPLSYPLRVEAARRADEQLDRESGYPALVSFLQQELVPTVRSSARSRAVADIMRSLTAVSDAERAELRSLDDPGSAAAELAELSAARDRLATMSAGGARWRTVLQDEITDLNHEVTFHFRDRIRAAVAEMESAVDGADGKDELEAAGADLQSNVVAAAAHGFEEVETGVDEITRRIATLLGLDEIEIGTPEEIADSARTAASSWSERDGTDQDGSTVQDTISALRGAQGGILMFAVMGGLLPAAAATVVAATPFVIGAGVLFGGKQILDLRGQRRQRAKQKMKLSLRKAVDELQFRVGAELADALRIVQRHLRDELTTRIEEIHRTTAETVARLESARDADETQRRARLDELRARAARFDEIEAAAGPLRRRAS